MMSDSLSQHSLHDSMDAVPISNSSLLHEPPIPTVNTYQAPSSEKTEMNVPPLTWNMDNFMEQPRGHVAKVHFVGQQEQKNMSGYTYDEPFQEAPYATQAQFTSLGLSPTLLSILAYFFGFLGGAIIMILEKKNLFVIFHAWQSICLGVISFIVQILFVWSNTLYTLLWIVYLLLIVFLVFKVINDAPSQRLFKCKVITVHIDSQVPIVGDWCEHRAINKVGFSCCIVDIPDTISHFSRKLLPGVTMCK